MSFDWKPVRGKNWTGEYCYYAAKIPNCDYGDWLGGFLEQFE